MYIKTNVGPRTEPWGTPDVTLHGVENDPLTTGIYLIEMIESIAVVPLLLLESWMINFVKGFREVQNANILLFIKYEKSCMVRDNCDSYSEPELIWT